MILENEELQARVSIPTITGTLWKTYWQTRFQHEAQPVNAQGQKSPGDVLEERWLSAMAIVDEASYIANGETRHITMDAPLQILEWAVEAVEDAIVRARELPKASS